MGESGNLSAESGAAEQVDLEKHKKVFSSLGFRFLLGTIAIYGVQILVINLVARFAPMWLMNRDIAFSVGMLPMYLIGMPIMILLIRKLPASVPEKHSMKPWHFVLAAIMCYGLMLICNLTGLWLTALIGVLKGSVVQNTVANVINNGSMWVNVLYVVICAPIIEEYVFRKLLVDRTLRYGQGVAVLMSGLLFGLFHGNLNQFVYAFPMGLFLAFLYVRTGKLKISIALHMICNFFGSVLAPWLVEISHMDEYTRLVQTGAGQQELAEFMTAYLPGWIAYMCYSILVYVIMLASVVLFIVFRKRFTLCKGEVAIPKGMRFKTIFVNVGMALCTLLLLALIIYQLLFV